MFCLMVFMCSYKYQMTVYELVFWWTIGSIFYTFSEYWFHRVILHYILHGAHNNHHRRPTMLRIIATPIIPLTAVDCLAVLLVILICGKKYAYGINCGIATGQILMDVTHVLFHSKYRPWFLEAGRSYHNYHHYRSDDEAHGLTTPFWDMLFGTLPKHWKIYQDYPWLKYVSLPFPLLTFAIVSFLSGMESKSTVVEEADSHMRTELHRELFTYTTIPLIFIFWELADSITFF